MEWKERIIRLRRMDSEKDPGESGTLNLEDLEPPTNQDSQDPSTDTGIESPFKSETLKGLSVEEVEALIKLQESTIREQGKKLNESARNSRTVETPAPPKKEEEEEEVDAADFWKNPGEILKKHQEKTVDKVRQVMDEMIAPFRNNLKENERESVWTQLQNKYPDSVHLRGLMDDMVEEAGIEDPKLGALETIYFAIKGRLSHIGKTVEDLTGVPSSKPKNGDKPKSDDPPMTPHRRPSSHPLPKPKADDTIRELTENERIMARQKWPQLPAKEAYKRFIQWQDADDNEVIGSTIGREAKK